MFCSYVLLITRDGKPAGFFLPWAKDDVPVDVRRVYRSLSAKVRTEMEAAGVTEAAILAGVSRR